jgi:hypothetical protein
MPNKYSVEVIRDGDGPPEYDPENLFDMIVENFLTYLELTPDDLEELDLEILSNGVVGVAVIDRRGVKHEAYMTVKPTGATHGGTPFTYH